MANICAALLGSEKMKDEGIADSLTKVVRGHHMYCYCSPFSRAEQT